MSERKVLTKYYPPDFDPRALGRSKAPKKAGPKVQTVRLMSPFSMQCTSCGEFIYKGRKFNSRKETPLDERYLGIQIYRFYIRCTRCSGEIIFRTDPKSQDYICEKGAKRNTDPWKRGLGDDPTKDETDDQRLDRIEREMAEADGVGADAERNAMAELEAKTADAKREMAVADALDEIRSRNARIERAKKEGVDVGVVEDLGVSREEEERIRQEREDEEAARRAFAFARGQDALEEVMDEDGEGYGGGGESPAVEGSSTPGLMGPPPIPTPKVVETTPTPPAQATEAPAPTFKRQVKKKKDHAALLGIKKKTPLV
ncbi:hypothetical protein GE09DRAFT_593732 [Coniochaeta sp. 2T2.1]|nr:hypothetical protein GE09DRAFT_593732 [Coniochaeta sp. 2T2.1]